MSTSKNASSQAAWALLTEGVTHARVEAHRLQHLVSRATSLVEASSEKEHLYQVAGDIIVAMPARLDELNRVLDRTALALTKMGDEFLSSRLPLSDKTMVDEAVESAFGSAWQREAAKRVAYSYKDNAERLEMLTEKHYTLARAFQTDPNSNMLDPPEVLGVVTDEMIRLVYEMKASWEANRAPETKVALRWLEKTRG